MMSRDAQVVDMLQLKAREIRLSIARTCHAVGEDRRAHPGPALSLTDLLVALYYHVMRIDPHNPEWPDRDRFILSKGHGCVALYAVLADLGYIPREALSTLRRPGSLLQGHPCMVKTCGVEMTAGSLGNGLGAAVGMAIAARMDHRDSMVYCVLGNGELNEGVVWEAAQTAAKYALGNLVAIVDHNGMQSSGSSAEIMPSGDLVAKWRAFGWNAVEIDGHDMAQIVDVLSTVASGHRDQPQAIIARTIKGKGFSFMEHDNSWHLRALTESEWQQAQQEQGGVSCS